MKKCCWLYANDKIKTYSACFIGKTVQELVDDFNQDVNVRELTQDRAYYHEALLHAFEERGVDVSAILQEDEISFEHPVRFDVENRALVVITDTLPR